MSYKYRLYINDLQGRALHQLILCLFLALTSCPFFSSAGTSTMYPSESIDPNSQVARWFSMSRLTLSPSLQRLFVCSSRPFFEFAYAWRSLAISYAMSAMSGELSSSQRDSILLTMFFKPVSVCHYYFSAYSLHDVLSKSWLPRSWIIHFRRAGESRIDR